MLNLKSTESICIVRIVCLGRDSSNTCVLADPWNRPSKDMLCFPLVGTLGLPNLLWSVHLPSKCFWGTIYPQSCLIFHQALWDDSIWPNQTETWAEVSGPGGLLREKREAVSGVSLASPSSDLASTLHKSWYHWWASDCGCQQWFGYCAQVYCKNFLEMLSKVSYSSPISPSFCFMYPSIT